MVPTREQQLMAIHNAFSADPGFAAPENLQQLKALATTTPTYGGAAPVLPAQTVTPDQPAPQPPLVGPDLMPGTGHRDEVYGAAANILDEARARANQARAFNAPGGVGSQLEGKIAHLMSMASNADTAAVQKNAAAQSELYGKQADDEQAHAAGMQIRAQEFHKRIEDAQRTADLWSTQAMNAEVRNFWADKSTGSRVLGVLAQTLSGAANGLAGNPSAPSPLDRIIDNDREVQKANIENKRAGASRAQNALAQAYNNFRDGEQAELAISDAQSKWVASKSNQLAAQLGGEKAAAANQMVQAQMKQKMLENQQKRADGMAQDSTAEAQGGLRTMAQVARDESGERQISLAHQGDMVEVPGVSVMARKALFNQAWTKQSQAFSGAFAQLDNIDRAIGRKGFAVKNYVQGNSGKALLGGDIRTILGTGANLSATEFAAVQSVSADYLKGRAVDSLTTGEYKDYVHAIRVSLARTFQARIRATFAGGDLTGSSGFESARAALDRDDTENAANAAQE